MTGVIRTVIGGLLLGLVMLRLPVASAMDPAPMPLDSRTEAGATASLQPDGRYEVRTEQPTWVFGGTLSHAPSRISARDGQDTLGAYDEIGFETAAPEPRRGVIRTYRTRPVALFGLTYLAPADRPDAFPVLSRRPDLPFRLSYRSVPFSPIQFNTLAEAADSPWLFFDNDASGYLFSAADNFLLARSQLEPGGVLTAGLDPNAGPLPAGFTQQSLLVAGTSINQIYDTWGQALTSLRGASRPANDADVSLRRLGYWTDNGASYYYTYEPDLGYAGTLAAVKDAFLRDGIPLGYLQLDSWWYPKGAAGQWDDARDGIATYTAAPELFPQGLSAFQQALGLPLITHARWIDPTSTYRALYATSGNVVTDGRYWDDRLAALAGSGVVTYEQDWLGAQAQPRDNLTDPGQFLGNMATAATRNGLTLQYCMPLPRHYLQGATYGALTTIRVSGDRFERGKWDAALYDSRLASALGIWPWVDVFMSSERENLLLATLSGGVVGVGDRIGSQDAASLRRAIRPDGVLVKPDMPLVPTDETYVGEAQGRMPPMVATTYTQHGSLRYLYVFTYARGTPGATQTASFTPGRTGVSGPTYVYDPDSDSGTVVADGATFSQSITDRGAYAIVAPVGPSGIAFLGDAARFVSLGRTRIPEVSDDGVLRASVDLVGGEPGAVLHGYALQAPRVETDAGSIHDLSYDPTSHLFSFTVSTDGAPARVQVTLSPGGDG